MEGFAPWGEHLWVERRLSAVEHDLAKSKRKVA